MKPYIEVPVEIEETEDELQFSISLDNWQFIIQGED